MKVVLRPEARADILRQAVYYLEEYAYAAADRFPEAVETAIDQIRMQPGIGSPRVLANPRLAGLRSWPVPGFEDIRIYYLHPEPKLIRIIRVLHGKRDVGRILKRVQA